MDILSVAQLWPPFGEGAGAVTSAAVRFRQALVAALLADAGVAAAVGAKVYPLTVPQGVNVPALLYQVTDDARQRDLDAPTKTATVTVRLAYGSKAFAGCEALADVLRLKFDGYAGTLPGGVVVRETVLADETDEWDAPDDGSARGTYWIIHEFQFLYREA